MNKKPRVVFPKGPTSTTTPNFHFRFEFQINLLSLELSGYGLHREPASVGKEKAPRILESVLCHRAASRTVIGLDELAYFAPHITSAPCTFLSSWGNPACT
jgi:hypothetical protein